MVRKAFLLFVFFSLIFNSCQTSTPGGSSFSGSTSAPVQAPLPDWVMNPYTRYNENQFLAAVGSGRTRSDAERNAIGNLIAQFGQSIHVDDVISSSFRQVISGSDLQWSEDTSLDTVMNLTTSFDTLIGAEFGEAWSDGNTHYVTAILNKPRAALVYGDMLRANLAMMDNLMDYPESERYTLSSYVRTLFAATIADLNVSYGNLLQQIGYPMPGIRNGDEIRLEAWAIRRDIPIGITVNTDALSAQNRRIVTAFSAVLSDLGFQIGGENSRFILDIEFTLSPVVYEGNPFLFSRIELSADLRDTFEGRILLPYGFNERVGHSSQTEADNRVILMSERRIGDEYPVILNDYLERLLLGN